MIVWSREKVLLLCLVLLAFALRVFRLGTQSLWGDEAGAVYRAALSLGAITAEVPREVTLPPLYYYLLHFWLPVAGRSETAVRFLSVLWGVLAIALLYVLVQRTLGRRAALLAAALATLSPFWIYYAQETRAYALLTALVLLALYLLVRAGLDEAWAASPSPWLWCAYAVAAALALYSFYFAGFALAAATVWLLVVRRRQRGVLVRCLLAQVGALALVAPLLAYTAVNMVGLAGGVARGGISLPTILRQLALAFSFGTTARPEQVWPLVVMAVALTGLGLLARPRSGAAFWGLVLVLPVLAIYAVSFVPMAGWARYFMAASPAWYALVGSGIAALAGGVPTTMVGPAMVPRGEKALRRGWQLLRWGLAYLASLSLLAGMALALRNYYFDPAYWRHDLRGGARQVEAVASPDVAVVVNGPPQFPSFFYYFQQAIPWAELPQEGRDSATAALANLAAQYRGLWLVKYRPPDYDPDGLVEVWLGTHAHKAAMRWVENVTYSFYLTPDPAAQAVASFPVGRTFGDDAELVAYQASVARAQEGDYLLATLTWRALRTPPADLSLFAHLLDGGGARLAQSDHRAVDDTRPSWTWQAGDLMEDRFALRLPPDYQGRGLRLAVGLAAPGGRVPPREQSSPDGSLALPLPGLTPLRVGHALAATFGPGLALRGYDLAPNPVRAGEALALTLYWQRQGAIERDYTVFTHLLDAGPRVVAQKDSPPLGGQRPTTSWLPGEILADRYEIPIAGATAPGRYQIELGLYDPATGARLPVFAGAAAGDRAPGGDRVLLPEEVEVLP